MDNSSDIADNIVLERKLAAPWGLFASGIALVLSAIYFQIYSNLFYMSPWHWGIFAIVFGLLFFRPVLNAGRIVRFQIDKRGIRFDQISGSRCVTIEWVDIERISLCQIEGWTISIKLAPATQRERSLTTNELQISEHYGMPLDQMYNLLVSKHEKYKSLSK